LDLKSRIEKFDYIIELLRRVIVLLEHSSIQSVRSVVKDVDPSAFIEEEVVS